MSKGGTTTSTQTNTMDPNMAAHYNDIYARGQSAVDQAGNPYTSYTGALTAGFNPSQSTAQSAATSNLAGAQGLNTYGTLSNLMGQNAGTVGGADLSTYMNPYTQNVIDSTMNTMEQSRKQALQGIGDNAIAAGAFGGDRQGVAEGVTNAQYGLNEGQMAAGLNQANYQNAQSMAQQDIQNRLAQQGQTANTVNLGLGAQNNGVQSLYNIGLGQQNTEQSSDTAKYNQYLSGSNFPQSQISYLSSLLSAMPQQGTTTTQQPYYTNPFAQVAGTALMASQLLSDRRMKRDIKAVGKLDNGLTVYAYRYKNDPDGPFMLGVMADEAKELRPESVVTLAGVDYVNYEKAVA